MTQRCIGIVSKRGLEGELCVVDGVATLLEADKGVGVRGKDNRLGDSNGEQISNQISMSNLHSSAQKKFK